MSVDQSIKPQLTIQSITVIQKYAVFILLGGFCIFEILCFYFGNAPFVFIAFSGFLAVLFFIILLIRHNAQTMFSGILYAIILLQFVLRHNIIFLAITTSVLFFPVIYIFSKTLPYRINLPTKLATLLLFIGFFSSLFYQWCNSNYPFDLLLGKYDFFFFAEILTYYSVYLLMKVKILTLHKTFRALIASGILFACYIVFAYWRRHELGNIFFERLGNSIDINPNLISSYLELILPLSVFTGIFEKNILYKIAWIASACLLTFIILLCNSRGSLLGLSLLVGYLILSIKRTRFRMIIIGLSLLGIFIFGPIYYNRLTHPSFLDLLSNAGRLKLLKTAVIVIKENHYVFGIGMNNFSLMKFHYGFPSSFDFSRSMSSHNQYMEIWLGWGFPALLGWIIYFCGTGILLIRKSISSSLFPFKMACFFSLVFFITHGLVDSIIASPELMLYPFVILGCCQYLIALEPETNNELAYNGK